MLRLLALAVLAACGSSDGGGGSSGAAPALTPAVGYALNGIAPQCKMNKDATGERRSCTGRHGTIELRADASNRVREVAIQLYPTYPELARGHLSAALLPLIQLQGVQELATSHEALRFGDRSTIYAGGATVDLVSGGESRVTPAYSATLRW